MNGKITIGPDTAKKHIAKYTNKNPVHRFTLGRFFDSIAKEIYSIKPQNVIEFGCGEGLLLQELKKRNIIFKRLTGIDLRMDGLHYASSLHPEYSFIDADIMEPPFKKNQFDLVIASQVLEHLYEPDTTMAQLVSLSCSHLLLTVPWEPWFRLMNLLRGRNLLQFGNHPEHVRHWSFHRFREFIKSYVFIEKAYTVFPFIIIMARVSK